MHAGEMSVAFRRLKSFVNKGGELELGKVSEARLGRTTVAGIENPLSIRVSVLSFLQHK